MGPNAALLAPHSEPTNRATRHERPTRAPVACQTRSPAMAGPDGQPSQQCLDPCRPIDLRPPAEAAVLLTTSLTRTQI